MNQCKSDQNDAWHRVSTCCCHDHQASCTEGQAQRDRNLNLRTSSKHRNLRGACWSRQSGLHRAVLREGQEVVSREALSEPDSQSTGQVALREAVADGPRGFWILVKGDPWWVNRISCWFLPQLLQPFHMQRKAGDSGSKIKGKTGGIGERRGKRHSTGGWGEGRLSG